MKSVFALQYMCLSILQCLDFHRNECAHGMHIAHMDAFGGARLTELDEMNAMQVNYKYQCERVRVCRNHWKKSL